MDMPWILGPGMSDEKNILGADWLDREATTDSAHRFISISLMCFEAYQFFRSKLFFKKNIDQQE